jgi:GPI mannosyltransferase 3
MASIFKSSYKNFFLASLLIYLVTAYFSEGFHHPDEQFQILEFCNYKLGKSPAKDLPWEFDAKIRPALQPAIAYVLVKAFTFVGITSPFVWALLMRLMTALMLWYITCRFCVLLLPQFSTDLGKKIFILLNLFLWFIPYISVRFSSENYSALAFMSAVFLLMNLSEGKQAVNFLRVIFAGLLLGFSFYFRFQIAFAILGLGLWLLFTRKMKFTYWSFMIISGACSITICIFIDYWFYEDFQLTPVNYFVSNIIENKAAQWGTHGWWYYFWLFFQLAIPPLSIFLLIFFFIGLYKKPTDVFTWCIIPFLIAHFWVGHKEMRFMFPMALCFMYLTAIGVDLIIHSTKYARAIRIMFTLSVIINLPLLTFRMFMPAREAIGYLNFINDYSTKNKVDIFCFEKDAYKLGGDLSVNFYRSPIVSCREVKDNTELTGYLMKEKPSQALILETTINTENTWDGYKAESAYCFYPLWIRHFNIGNWQSRTQMWNIKRIEKIK